MDGSTDILMITYNRPQYTELTLKRLLDTCDESMRVWVWHNGTDKATLNIINSLHRHPRFYKFYHSRENKKLNIPTNWLWTNSDADYFAKVDDDCIVPFGWANTLRQAHQDISKLAIVACWHFMEEDVVPELAKKKIQSFTDGHSIMRNCWVGGSGYLMKRQCFDRFGTLKSNQTFTGYCIKIAKLGYIIGWYHPFLYQKHLDDPRCSESLLKCDADMQKWAPLSAINNGVHTIEAWQAQLKRSARLLQTLPYDPKHYTFWRKLLKQIKGKIKRMIGIRQQW